MVWVKSPSDKKFGGLMMTTKMRARVEGHHYPYYVFIDDQYAGNGTEAQCIAMVNDLNKSDQKCNKWLAYFAAIRRAYEL